MQKIVLLISFISILWCNDNLEKSSSLFKEGFDSLINDMQEIKENNHQNSVQIKALNKKFDYIIAKLQKETVASSISSSEVSRLQNTILALEEKVATLEYALQKDSNTPITEKRVESNQISKSIKEEEKEYYAPSTKKVIISDTALDKIEQSNTATYSIQVGIFRKQKSLNNAKTTFEKLIDKEQNKIVFELCTSCKNEGLTKVIIEGFHSKKQAQQFVEANNLKNSMIIDNRG